MNGNRWSVRPVKKSEIWTLDGTNLNELYFVSGLIEGETLFRDVNRKERPLPTFRAASSLTDIPEFIESSMRIAFNTSVYQMDSVEPMTFAGQPGVRFKYSYAVEGTPLTRKGIGSATIVGGKLHMIIYTAPALYFFDRDAAKAETIMASAAL